MFAHECNFCWKYMQLSYFFTAHKGNFRWKKCNFLTFILQQKLALLMNYKSSIPQKISLNSSDGVSRLDSRSRHLSWDPFCESLSRRFHLSTRSQPLSWILDRFWQSFTLRLLFDRTKIKIVQWRQNKICFLRKWKPQHIQHKPLVSNKCFQEVLNDNPAMIYIIYSIVSRPWF